MKEYAEKNGKTYAYYRPTEDSTDARVESITAAIDKGAKIVVLPGYLFAETAAIVQEKYPDVSFVILDTQPTGTPAKNTYSILYHEEQAGYFAGYAIVKDGNTKLGFLGGMAVPAVVRYGYGFAMGADAAAKEMGVKVDMKYWYADTFGPNDDIKTKMGAWFSDGIQSVFCCGGGIYLSAIAAAQESKNVSLIGVDKDQAFETPLFISSAMKNLTGSVVLALTKIYENGGKLPEDLAGATNVLGIKEDCVGLPTVKDSWRFKTFTLEDYNALYAKIKDGTIVVSDAIDAKPVLENVSVDYQN